MGNETQRPEIVCLCGSLKHKAAFLDWEQRFTEAGKIVVTVGRMLPREEHASDLKAELDTLHKRKIDLADRVFVLDVGGYVGESTADEAAYAKRQTKAVDYLSILFPEYGEPDLADTDIGRAVLNESNRVLKAGPTTSDDPEDAMKGETAT